MKYIVAIFAALTLAGCGYTAEDQKNSIENVQRNLPDGCKLYYAGEVKIEGVYPSTHVFTTICGKVVTTTSNRSVYENKVNHDISNVSVSFIE